MHISAGRRFRRRRHAVPIEMQGVGVTLLVLAEMLLQRLPTSGPDELQLDVELRLPSGREMVRLTDVAAAAGVSSILVLPLVGTRRTTALRWQSG